MLALNNKIHRPHSVCLGFLSTSKINVVVLPLACALVGKNTCCLTLNLLAPTKVGARINPYPANVEKMVSS